MSESNGTITGNRFPSGFQHVSDGNKTKEQRKKSNGGSPLEGRNITVLPSPPPTRSSSHHMFAPDIKNEISGLEANTAHAPMDLRRATEQLYTHFYRLSPAVEDGQADGLIDRHDLRAVAENPGLPRELQAAAKFLLDNPAAFNAIVGFKFGGPKDGWIGKADLKDFLATVLARPQMPEGRPLNLQTAAKILLNNLHAVPHEKTMPGKHWAVGADDLKAVAGSKTLHPDLRQAAKFFADQLDNQAMGNTRNLKIEDLVKASSTPPDSLPHTARMMT